MKRLNHAYEVLSHPAQRMGYDHQSGAGGPTKTKSHGYAQPSQEWRGSRQKVSTPSVNKSPNMGMMWVLAAVVIIGSFRICGVLNNPNHEFANSYTQYAGMTNPILSSRSSIVSPIQNGLYSGMIYSSTLDMGSTMMLSLTNDQGVLSGDLLVVMPPRGDGPIKGTAINRNIEFTVDHVLSGTPRTFSFKGEHRSQGILVGTYTVEPIREQGTWYVEMYP